MQAETRLYISTLTYRLVIINYRFRLMAEAFKNMDHDECVSLTRTIMAILDGWGLNGAAIMHVLAIPQGVPVRALR